MQGGNGTAKQWLFELLQSQERPGLHDSYKPFGDDAGACVPLRYIHGDKSRAQPCESVLLIRSIPRDHDFASLRYSLPIEGVGTRLKHESTVETELYTDVGGAPSRPSSKP